MKATSFETGRTTVTGFAVAVVLALVASLTATTEPITSLRTVAAVEPTITVTGSGTATVGRRYEIDVAADGLDANRISQWTVNWGDGTIDRRRGKPGPIGHVYSTAGLTHGVTVSVSDGATTWTSADVVVASYDAAETVARYHSGTGTRVGELASTGGSLRSAAAAIIGPDGLVYVAGGASNTIERFDPADNSHVDSFVSAAAGGLRQPRGLAFGPDGNLYVASSGTGQVLRFDGTSGGFIDVFVDSAGTGSGAGPAGQDPDAGLLVRPVALGFGPDGRLLVVDRDDDDIERYDAESGDHVGTLITFDGGARPSGLARGPDGVLYVALSGAGVVAVVDTADIADRKTGDAGTGTGEVVDRFGAGQLGDPRGVALGPDGMVWVADYRTNSIERFDPTNGSLLPAGIERPGPPGPQLFGFTADHRVVVGQRTGRRPATRLDADQWRRRAGGPKPGRELRFAANDGLADGGLDFVAGGQDYDAVLADGDVIVAIDGEAAASAIRMDLVGASPDAVVDASGSADESGAAEVTYRDVYPGIDVVYGANGQEVEYSLIVDPGADPGAVSLDFEGATDLQLQDDGSIRFTSASGNGLVMTAPIAFQGSGDSQTAVDSAFDLRADGTVGFIVGSYDPSLPLIIDPTFKAVVAGTSGGGTTITITRPAGVVSGDVLLAAVTQAQNVGVTPPAGWTAIRSDVQGAAVRQDLFYKVATVSEPSSYVFTTAAGGQSAGAIVAYSGVDFVNPIDAKGGQGNTTSTGYGAPSITTTAAGTTLVGFFGSVAGAATTPPAGMTERADQPSGTAAIEVADEILGGAGSTGSRTATGSSSVSIGQLVALTPALPVVVNSTADNSDANPGDGACDTGGTNSEGDPRCTLRAAIQEANASTTINRIDFDIPATEAGYEPSPLAFRIQPSGSVLPNITDPVVIDGSTQPEFVGAGRPVIVLDGAAAPMSGDPNGLSLNAGNSTIRGLVIQNFGEDGIEVDVNGNNLIAGNYIGTDVTGTVARPNGTMDVAPVGGISIKTDGNTIGGPSAADRNIISGNTQLGLGLRDGATNNVVLGNHIGTDAAGTGAIPNAGQGIWIDGTSGNNTIGGPGAGEGNLISGNNATNTAASAGIYVLSSGNVIQGNRIGTDVAGTANLENNGPGVALTGSAADNLIGGTAAGEGNVIGFNKGDGVRLFSAAGSGNSVLGNSIFASEDPGLGIDLKNDAVTANDAGDGDSGVNGLLNYPVITSADESGGTVTVTFDLDVPANPDQYRIEFFTNPSGVDASGYGEAEIFAGAVTTGPGSGLTHAFAGSAGDVITATATRIDTGATTRFSSTSEISAIAVATSGPCADSDGDGLCDLEEDANLDADGDPATNPGPDTDGDTTPNHLDADDDGDGTPTASENADPNGDGDPRDARDADRDGQPDYLDDPTTASDGTVATEQKISETSGGFGGGLTTNDHFGRSVAGIGDIDGDGVADIAVGAPWDDDGSSDRGAIHVLFLNADGTVKAEQKISDTAGGFAALLDNSDEFGIAVAGIGDLDGDLIGDIAVGAHQDDDGGGNFGAVYVLFLNADGTVKAEQKISATQGGLGGVLGTNDRFGSAIAGIGDLDGDGLNDIVVGAKDDDDGGVDQGAVYVLFLNADGTVKAEQKISESSGGLGPVLDTSDGFGIGVAGLGDIDGDGAGDIAVGAYWDDDGGTNRGAVHILRLDTDGTIKAQQKISDTQGGFGATLDSNDEFGLAVGGVGDLDLDGVPDLVVGAPKDGDGASLAGAAYVLFLNANGTVKAEQKISNLDGWAAAPLGASDQFGFGVSGIGDLDGDGTIGLAVGVYGDDDGGPADRGAVYVLDLAVPLAGFVVNSTGDASDANPGNGSCDTGGTNSAGDPACTLRAAIQEANALAGDGMIVFSMPATEPGHAGGVWTISPGSALPAISTTISIDGTTQTGYTSTPVVEINGTSAGGSTDGFRVLAGNVSIRGLAINRFGADGIEVNSTAANGLIAGNHIGLDASGLIDRGNGARGIDLQAGSGPTTVGGTTAADRNVISDNGNDGIIVWDSDNNVIIGNYLGTDVTGNAPMPNAQDGIALGSGSAGNTIGQVGAGNVLSGNGNDGFENDATGAANTVRANIIGLGADGSTDVPNGRYGVVLYNGANNTAIGGSGAGEGNVISRNVSHGVMLDGNANAATTANSFAGNLIGTDSMGLLDRGNGGAGLYLYNGVNGTVIGGATAGHRNIISGNGTDGIYLQSAGTTGTIIRGNHIGVDSTGNAPLPNSDRGVQIESGADNTIVGGTGAGEGNVISANGNDGIIISDGAIPGTGTSGTVIEGNKIGVGADGTTALGNGTNGVRITTESGHRIGGTSPAAGNVIANNSADGVMLQNASATANPILGNAIGGNGQEGIDLGNNGVTANDGGDGDSGANDLLNFPVITSAEETGGTVTLTFDLDVPTGAHRVEFFANPSGADGSGNGEGEVYLGGNDFAAGTGLTFDVSGAAGDVITATATRSLGGGSYGSTSEFASAVTVVAASCTDTDSDGDGLWDCEEDANTDADDDPSTNPGPDTDGDTTPNYLDPDDDGDGIPTASEDADPNGDGDPRDAIDSDWDGQPDWLDPPSGPSNGLVDTELKISSTVGGLTGPLDDNDLWGTDVSAIGDLDGDGITDVAVGVRNDDDGGTDRGAIYILFLNADGTVKGEQKISDTQGGLSATLDNGDGFGDRVASIGDLDGDGINEIAASIRNDDDGGTDRGALVILFLNTDGTVRAEQKISSTQGGFSAPLDDGDAFGDRPAGIGDLDGDGVNDIAVGSNKDDDGGTDRGAVYILFLNPDGSVKSEQKVSDTAGGLTASLGDEDYFGIAVTDIGDLDGDGITDIAVGARGDDDGGAGRGAIYILFLNADGTVKDEQKISDTQGGLTASLGNSDEFGSAVAGLGDLDDDGTLDLGVAAPRDDDGGTSPGALYILFLDPDGTVKAEQKISSTQGGFTGPLGDDEYFGDGLSSLGDLDGDGAPSIVVAAPLDDDGGTNRGAVYILELAAPPCGADSDGDGLWDCEEDANTDADDDPSTNPGPDTDGDTLPNHLDADDDGDGTPTASENADPNADGDPRDALDSDRDGQPDYLDKPTGDSGGTVENEQKISDLVGGLAATLDDSDRLGRSAASIGDLDGDGVNDIAVGALDDDDGGTSRGAVYVLFLDADGTVKAEQKISDTAGGLTATLDDSDTFGVSVAGVGDLDGDGVNDIAVGSSQDDDGGTNRGAVYVLFLNADGTVKGQQKISDTAGGLTATLDDSDTFGVSVAGVGDLDGDGVNDIAVGAHQDDDGGTNRGAVYVLFLNADGTVKGEQKISDTAGGLTATLDDSDTFGVSVAGVGDLDGDGITELAVGTYLDDDGGTNRGAVYVLFLDADGTVKAEQKISDTAGGLTATLDNSDTFGVSVAGVGDLDGDGRIDLAVGAHQDDDGGTNRGAVYVLFLNADGTVKGEQKISDTAGGLTATLDDSDTFGVSVAGVGDLDGDGRIDLAVGAFRDDDGGTDRGAIHVLQMGPPMPAVNSTGDASDANPGDDVCDTGGTVGGDPECTLRAAIEEANASPSIDTIHFAIPASDSGHSGGVWTINPTTGLPTITDGVIVDGTTQSGWTASTTAAPAGLDGTQVVVIDGAGTVADGLRLAGDDITVRGLVIGGFDGDGVVVTGARAIVQAAYVGTGAAGSVANPNTGNGMTVAGVDAVIGSSGPADRMLVSGNGGQGIEILATASNAAVLGSIVGLDAAATAALANGANGLRLSGSTGTTVGAPGAGNVIAGNNLAPATAGGIYVSGGSGHTIRANLIGTNLADAPLGNFNAGVAVSSATGVTIGGSLAGDGNTIARNGGDGITITGAGSTVSVLGNSMSNNGDLGIDLAGDGVTANDAGDGDSGPNGLLNSPVLVAADVSGSVVVVDYSLDAPAGTYRLEFYGNPAGGDPSGYGEGGTLLGTASLVHGGSGPQSGTAVFAAAVGTVLSATTTEDLGGGFYGSTSEFSAVIVSASALLPSVEDLSIRRSDLRADGGLDPGSAEVAGLAGRAMALDGVAERLQGPALDIASGELTMEALIRLDSLSGAPRVVSKSNAASTPIYELFVDGGTGEAVASIRVGGAAATARGGVVSTATWHHLSATWDGTELILFVDGAEVDRVPAVGALAVDVTTDVVIGADGAAAQPLHGLVDDVRVSHRATTAPAVAVRHLNVGGSAGLVSVGAEQTSPAGAWTVSGVRSRSGGFSLQAPETSGPGAAAWAVATGIDEPGVAFESWWWAATDTGVDLSSGTRTGSVPTDQYEAALTSPSGWELRRRNAGSEIVDAAAAGTPSAGTWVKVEIRTDQLGDSRVLVDGVEVTGWTAQGADLASGSMGLRVGSLPSGQEWSIDDARGRRLITPEPVAGLGPLDRN